jgi:Domain of unknown function (DUF4129)
VKRATLSLLVLVMFASGGVARAQTELSVDAYRARLGLALAALRDGNRDPVSVLRAANDILGLPVAVSLDDGSTVLVTAGSLLGNAEDGGDADAVAATTSALQLAIDAADAASTTSPPDRAGIDRAVAQAYEELRPAGPSWIERVLAGIEDVLGWLVDHALGPLVRSGLGSVVGWTIVLLLIGGVYFLARRIRRTVVPDARAPSSGGGTAIVDWRRVADDAIAAGDLSAAVPALYHVLLGTLDARGVVRDAPALTSGECRGAVHARRPALAPSVDEATAAFERVVYGKLPASERDVDALRAADRVVRGS